MYEINNIYYPSVGKNLIAQHMTERQENGFWEESVAVKVRGKIIVWKPEGGMKNVRTA